MVRMSRRRRTRDLDSAVRPEWLAGYNQEAQERLIIMLNLVADAGHHSHGEIAEAIGTEPEVIEDALAGRLDLNFTEIRHIALAINAVVEYRVSRAEDIEDDHFEGIRHMTTSIWEHRPVSSMKSYTTRITSEAHSS